MTIWMPKKKPLYAPMLATFGGGSIQGFKSGGGAIDFQLDQTQYGGYWNNYNTSPTAHRSDSTNVNIDGMAKIVLNGYGILFYGWSSQNSGSNLRSITLPDILLDQYVDIEFVGVGGPSRGGGSGGTAGGCGGRLVHEVKNLSYGIKTGGSNEQNNNAGNEPECNLELLESGRSGAICSAGHNTKTGSTQYGVPRNNVSDGSYPIYRTQGFAEAGRGAVDSGYSNTWRTLIPQRDTDCLSQASRGGAGRGLNQFAGINDSVSTGYGLGGGGGAQNASQYGGSSAGSSGGRYGYDGGSEANSGGGPASVQGLGRSGTYTKGGGGCFGGGSGDAGNNSTTCGSGGGAILMRWDTTAAYSQVGFQSGRQGWP